MELKVTINNQVFRATSKTLPVDVSLNNFIRQHAYLTGTKFMCLEGGCGACVVTVKKVDPFTRKTITMAVNSCLMPIYSCHGLEVTTIEGVGNSKIGYSEIQKRLSHFNGSQCGFCSPGMVMNMHGLMQSSGGKLTMEVIENSFGGNICRCTGYRPILDAFKSLATNATEELLTACRDIEDLHQPQICPRTNQECNSVCESPATHGNQPQEKKKDMKWYEYCNVTDLCGKQNSADDDDDIAGKEQKPIQLGANATRKWFKVFSIRDIFTVLQLNDRKPYMLVGGNTADGVYRRPRNIQVFIDITGVAELHSYSIGSVVELGGNVSITTLMEVLNKAADQSSSFAYCKQLVSHIDLVANVPVRNNGTVAGNLMIKNQRIEFPSDIFLLLETVGAKVTITSGNRRTVTVSPVDFLKQDMNKKVISKITLPALDKDRIKFMTYKIMPRSQNVHAVVNAGFLLKMTGGSDKIASASIYYGGINPQFMHATNTEKFLVGKNLYDNKTLQDALAVLKGELNPDEILPDFSPEYRKGLALALFYKFALNTSQTGSVNTKYQSGGSILVRPLSSGRQEFETDPSQYPLTENIPKYEGMRQCAGEAIYVNDYPDPPHMLYAAFVVAKEVQATILDIDASQALKMEGVHSFFSAKDIPGINNFMHQTLIFTVEPEELFCSGVVKYNGQPVGIILAETLHGAYNAAAEVKIRYKDTGKKIFPTIFDKPEYREKKVLDLDGFSEMNLGSELSGHFEMGLQYHFSMETQCCLTVPTDEGLTVFATSQWMDHVHSGVAQVLNVPQNSINVLVKRLGGSYGCKISRASMVACSSALGAYLTKRPVRLLLNFEANMQTIGKRNACVSDYTVLVGHDGKILKLKNRYASDYGCYLNDPVDNFLDPIYTNCYDIAQVTDNVGEKVRTDSASQTYCRAPGSAEGIAMIENTIYRIAKSLGLDTNDVRMVNIAEAHPIKAHMRKFLTDIDYQKRKTDIATFNAANRWKKRGIEIVPMQFGLGYAGLFNVTVSIYHTDGTVTISHGGIECGQGLNTKAIQVAAQILGLTVDKIAVKHSRVETAPNNTVSGGSMTSDAITYAVKGACEVLLARILPIRKANPNAKWEELIAKCFSEDIDLCGNFAYKAEQLNPYYIYGLGASEVLIDILTGQVQIVRVDILEDTGVSMSPGIDVGQIEGAFMMGIGYFLYEKLVYDRESGLLLTDRTWTYHPPGAKDIPIDFRINLIQNNPNPAFVLRSKATGEPAFCLAVSVVFALRNAIASARSDGNLPDYERELGAPTTLEDVFLAAGSKLSEYKLN